MVRTHFTAELDPNGVLHCTMKNSDPGHGVPLNCQYTAPLVFFKNIPLQIKYLRNVLDEITVSCPLDGTRFWSFNLIFEGGNSGERRLSPFSPSVSFSPSVNHRLVDHELLLCYNFSLNVTNICHPFGRTLGDTSNVAPEAAFIVNDAKIPFNKKLFGSRSNLFSQGFIDDPIYYEQEVLYHSAANVEQFVKLVCLHQDFKFDSKNIAPLMILCDQYSTDECFVECVNFLLRSETWSKLDIITFLEKFPRLENLKSNMIGALHSEHTRDGARLWPHDHRETTTWVRWNVMNPPGNVQVRFPTLKLMPSDIVSRRDGWKFHRVLNTTEGENVYRWNITIVLEYTDNRFVANITADNSHPWFVDAEIFVKIHRRDVCRPQLFQDRLLATPTTGYRKFLMKNRVHLDIISRVEIRIEVQRAYLNDIQSLLSDYEPSTPVPNFTVTVADEQRNGKFITKDYPVVKEMLLQTSDYFNTCLSDRWNNQNNRYSLDRKLLPLFEIFLDFMQNPYLVINDNNFMSLLRAADFFSAPHMLHRLEDYYRGCLISSRVRNAADKEFPVVFAKEPILITNQCLTLAEVENWTTTLRPYRTCKAENTPGSNGVLLK